MSCSLAVTSSPAFSPASSRSPLTCKTSPEVTNLYHLHTPDGSPSSCSSSPPFRLRFQRGPSGLRARGSSSSSSSSSSPVSVESPKAAAAFNRSCGWSGLKRKRPARIEIPLAEAMTFSPAFDGGVEVGVDGGRFSVFSKRGKRRVEMEDRHRANLDIHGDPRMAFFGIFDGHGGTKAAEFTSENMCELIVEEATREGREEGVCGLEDAVRTGYLRTDEEFLKEGVHGGVCCVTAFVKNGDLVVSNVGDCRAVLSRAGTADALTSDHKPSREDEKERIESLGGYVDYCGGVWRLQGTLAVSRGIGDMHLKQWVIPEPETRTLPIKPECEFLILASDGFWDKVSNQEAVDTARPLCMGPEKPSLLAACRKLADLSAARGSADDISVMIIQLGHFI